MKKAVLAVFAMVLGASVAASATTINFAAMTPGTVVTSGPDTTFSLGGSGLLGAPTIGGFFCSAGNCGLANSSVGGAGISSYPTANDLITTFTHGVSNLSFSYDNWGCCNGTTYYAYSGLTLVATLDISGSGGGTFSVPGTDITSLVIDNNFNDWVFGVTQMTFTPTPEPSSLLLLGSGILGLAGMLRRKMMAR